MKKGLLICTILAIITISFNISKINYSEELEDVNVTYDEKMKMDSSVETTTNSGLNSNLYYYFNDVEEDTIIKEETKQHLNNEIKETIIDTGYDKKENSKTKQENSSEAVVNSNENENNNITDNSKVNSEDVKKENNNATKSIVDEKQESNNNTPVEEEKKDNNLDNKNIQDKIPSIKDKLTNQKLGKMDTKVQVIDKSAGKMCADAIEYFYEDTNYKYYFTCKKSSYMYVLKDGKEYKLVDALKNNIVTMQELNDNGYQFPKKSKNLVAK